VPIILSVANQKGGVGKTTTATNLAHALGLAGRSVLVVDIDPQGNATSGMGVEIVPESHVFAPAATAESVVDTRWKNVRCLPASRNLERLAAQGFIPPNLLKQNLERLDDGRFDVVLIDCPPSLGHLTRNALTASEGVLIPIQCEYYPLEGLVQLVGTIRHEATHTALRVVGILLTMYDPVAELSKEVEAEVRGKLTEPVFNTVIPRDTAVAEAPSHCLSVIEYAPRSKGARAYVELALEVLDRGIVR
jgi:chromosome partitioning protein